MRLSCMMIEDDLGHASLIKGWLERVGFASLDGIFEDATSALPQVLSKNPDVLLMDIELPGMDGMAFFKALPMKPLVIFQTSHIGFAPESYEVDAVDFLVKPYSEERLIKALSKAFQRKFMGGNMTELADNRFVVVRTDQKMVRINYSDLYYAESMQNYTRIYTKDGVVMVLLSLHKLEEFLPDDEFVRPHRSFLVNLNFVDKVTLTSVFVSKSEIPLSKGYREYFEKKWTKGRYLSR